MLRLSTRSRYGLRALVNIAYKTRLGKTATAVEIAEEENISEKYLEQLLSFLRNQGIITGKRGSKGGYKLKLKEDGITVFEIIEIFEGPIEPVFCVNDADACERAHYCVTRDVWLNIYEAVKQELSRITLKDLVNSAISRGIFSKQRPKSRRIC
jgi:Rrf2 family protein